MYGIRHIPVHWLVGFFNIMSVFCDVVYGTAERTWTFFSTLFWNLTGLDQYVVFQDLNPTPIPYRFYMLGGLGDREWYYNMRTRVFELKARGISRKFLPALTIEYNQRVDRGDDDGTRRIIYDLTKWVDSVTFISFDGIFPHPMQLVAAWSLHTGIWPSFHNDDENQLKLTMMCGADGNSYDVPISLSASPFSWRRFAAGNEGSSTEASSDESSSDEEEDTEEDTDEESEEESEQEATDAKEEESEEDTEEEVVLPNSSEEKDSDGNNSTDSATSADEITQVTEIKETKPDSPIVLEDTPVDRNYFEEVD